MYDKTRGHQSPVFLTMIQAQHLRQLIEAHLEGSGNYLVDVTVSSANKITVLIENDKNVSIDDCVQLSRWLEKQLDRDAEDFSLEVSSPGIDQPFRVMRQYAKNIGREVDVVLKDGKKLSGKLLSADDNTIALEQQSKEKVEGQKGKQLVTRTTEIPFENIKETRIVIKF